MQSELTVDLGKIGRNAAELLRACRPRGITAMGVTKGCCGSARLAGAFEAAGMDFLADSRIENLRGLRGLGPPKVLLRLPRPSEAAETVRYADMSLNSEIGTMRLLSEEALRAGRRHGVILMVDLGDLREGIWIGDRKAVDRAVRAALGLKGLELAGLGANLTCYGGVVPTVENYTALCDLAQSVRDRYGIGLPIVSGGNSSCLNLLLSGAMPEGITNLRVNQAVLLGRELATGRRLEGWHDDAFTLRAEIIEVRVKPSRPVGRLAVMNAFGAPPAPPDRGMRKRALLSIGRQDMDCGALAPLAAGAEIVGASSDHMIVDIGDCGEPFRAGDWLAFRVAAYSGVLSAMASPRIRKTYLNGLDAAKIELTGREGQDERLRKKDYA